MSTNPYGNLGQEMKQMKGQREDLKVGIKKRGQARSREVREIKTDSARIVAQADEFLSETRTAGAARRAQTRKDLARADKELKAQARQVQSVNAETIANVQKDVADLKAQTRKELKAQARQTQSVNAETIANVQKGVAELKSRTQEILTQAGADLQTTARQAAAQRRETLAGVQKGVADVKAQANQLVTEARGFLTATHADNADLRAQTRQVLHEAGVILRGLTATSQRRAGEWRDIVRLVHGSSRGGCGSLARPACPPPPPATATKARKNRRSPAKAGPAKRKAVAGSKSR